MLNCSNFAGFSCVLSQGEAELLSGGRVQAYELSGRHYLEIQEVCAEDAGSYTCSVANSAGTATAAAELIVQGETTNQSQGGVIDHRVCCSWLSMSVPVEFVLFNSR